MENARPEARPVPSLAELFVGFTQVASLAFGGVLPWARFVLVERRQWVTEDEFVEILSVCQLLPGPNICNVGVALGARFHGLRGSLVCLAGLLAVPIAIAVALATVYARAAAVPGVAGALAGMAAAATGLVLGMFARMVVPVVRRRPWAAVPVICGVFGAVALGRWPLLPVMLAAVPVSLALHLRRP